MSVSLLPVRRRAVLTRRIRLLVAATITYNVAEAAVAVTAGAAASSTALIGFAFVERLITGYRVVNSSHLLVQARELSHHLGFGWSVSQCRLIGRDRAARIVGRQPNLREIPLGNPRGGVCGHRFIQGLRRMREIFRLEVRLTEQIEQLCVVGIVLE